MSITVAVVTGVYCTWLLFVAVVVCCVAMCVVAVLVVSGITRDSAWGYGLLDVVVACNVGCSARRRRQRLVKATRRKTGGGRQGKSSPGGVYW